MSTSATAPSPGFNGISTYASDLQSVITRAVAIASMPLTQYQDELQTMTQQQTDLNGLNADFTTLQSAIANIDAALGTGSYGATSSDSSAVSASVGSGAMEGTYTIDVSSIGSYSSSISNDTLPAVADPTSTSISTSGDYTLTAGGQTFDIQPSDGSLMGLAQAINSSSAGVQASLVNVGGSGSPQYRLVLQSANLGPDNIQLNDGTNDLLGTLNGGEDASYTVNGMSSAISSTSRTVTLAPGVTVNLLQPTTTGSGSTAIDSPVTVTVSRDASQLDSALSTFVSYFNTAVDALNAQTGPNAGSLSGQSTILDLRSALRQLTQYTGASGSVSCLAQMGVTLDAQGHLSFDSTQVTAQNISAVQSFLGDSTTGGFLQTATNAMNSVEDVTDGALTVAIGGIGTEIANENSMIATQQKKIGDLTNTLDQKMAAADALLASLESKKTYITNLFTAMINNNLTGSTGVSSS